MNYYASTIPITLAEKLKEKGYWNPGCTSTVQYDNACYSKDGRIHNDGVIADWKDLLPAPTYAEVFDWLLEKGIIITIRAYYFLNGERGAWQPHYNHWGLKRCESWHEAANVAIEKALTLI